MDFQVGAVGYGCADELRCEYGEWSELHRLRDVLVTEGAEAVIGGDEEVVAGDVRTSVERRSVGTD